MGGWLGGWVGGGWRAGAGEGEGTRKEASDVLPNNVLVKATGILYSYIEKQQLIKDCLCERSVMVYETKRPPSPFEKFL